MQRPPTPTLFPYTTLFRSLQVARQELARDLDVARERDRLQVGVRGTERHRRDDESCKRDRRDVIHWLPHGGLDRKSTRLNSSHITISYAVFCLKKKNIQTE